MRYIFRTAVLSPEQTGPRQGKAGASLLLLPPSGRDQR